MIDPPPAPPMPPRRKGLMFDEFTHFFDLAEVMLEPGLTIERVVFHTSVGLDPKTVVKLVVKRGA